jgi:hypothetical protein
MSQGIRNTFKKHKKTAKAQSAKTSRLNNCAFAGILRQ